jgi:hypothetical protein
MTTGHWPALQGERKMKKINFELIKKIDCLLVFIVAVIAIIGLLITFISEILPVHHSTPAHIEIVNSDDEEATKKTTETIDFVKKIKDVYVFSISTSAIKSNELSTSKSEAKQLSNSIVKGNSSSEIVNFIFVKDEQETVLFSSKAFIYKYQLANDNDSDTNKVSSSIKKSHIFNIYAVIEEDTNNDKQLDSNDKIVLYVSDFDGKNLKEISSSIYYLDLVDRDVILFTEYNDGKVYYYEYDGNSKNKKIIKCVEKELDNKYINLW